MWVELTILQMTLVSGTIKQDRSTKRGALS